MAHNIKSEIYESHYHIIFEWFFEICISYFNLGYILFSYMFKQIIYDKIVNGTGLVKKNAWFYFLFNKNVNSWHKEIFSTAFANLTE